MVISYPKHNSGHDDSFRIGNEFQDFVCIELAKQGIILQNINSKRFQYNTGENLQGFEIKFDGPHTSTNRLSIEIAEKSNPFNEDFIPSGIYRKGNTWMYIQGNYDLFFIFPVNILLGMHQSGKYEEAFHPKQNPTIKKFYLPHTQAFKYCAKCIDLRESMLSVSNG